MIKRILNARIPVTLTVLFLILWGSSLAARAEIYIWVDSTQVQYVSNLKPEWWTDEMDLKEPGTVVAPGAPANPGKFVGDRENRKFHWPKCEQIYDPEGKLAIPLEKQIWFRDYQEAIDQGLFVCDHCKPSEDGSDYQPKTP